jgi:two-component system, cell cycle response regulator DivK
LSAPRASRKNGADKGGPALVLVVDDFRDNREMYAEYLSHAGFRVAEAADGAEAVRLATEMRPDLVVMDLALPGMDGIEATRRIKKNPQTRRIPILALTGHALVKVAAQAREVGCDAFVTKPCLPNALAREIRRILGRRRSADKAKK